MFKNTLALIITLGFLAIVAMLFVRPPNMADPWAAALLGAIGAWGAAFTGIWSFYFGSSASSQGKDATLHAMTSKIPDQTTEPRPNPTTPVRLTGGERNG